tara:strand:+ start:1481 stop:2275 length:795 start_codon:yes stop_codon:yes gene_type:complete
MKIKNLKNIFNGKDIVILTCGPSLTEYSKKKIYDFCKNKIVFCVKDTFDIFKDICDVFISNQHRDRKYNFESNKKSIKIYQKDFENPKYNNYDILLENENSYRYGSINADLNPHTFDYKQYIISNPELSQMNKKTALYHWLTRGNYEARSSSKKGILLTHEFDKYNFNNKVTRPRGPGIMYESVFYLCLYFGCKNVFTLGWDLNTTGKGHFYNNIPILEKYKKEFKIVNENLPILYDYFKKQGMDIKVVGLTSKVNKVIPRVLI